MVKSFVLLLALLLSQPVLSQTATKSSLLWEVTGNGAKDTSYLFGTFHTFKSSFVDTMQPVMSRLGKSSAVVGEMLLLNPMDMMKGAGIMKSPKPLKALLGEADYKLADSVFKTLTGYGIGFFSTQKPMVAQSQMIQVLFEKVYPTDAKPNAKIIDMYFQAEGKANDKEVIGLETIEEQLQLLFGDITIERQAEMLMESLRELDSSKALLRQLADCYVANDMDCLERIGNESEDFSPAEMDALLHKRNHNWAKQLPDIFKKHRAFVAVGALHLPGEEGLVTLLRQQGYTVKPIAIR
jgi:uncharacterized protein